MLVDYRLCPYIRTTLNLFHHFVNVVTIQGEVNFVQNSPSENLKITVANVVGLKNGKHGFHIHKNENCKDPGSHYNPSEVKILLEY